MMTTIVDDMRAAAQRLAELNAASEPAIREIYLFPAENEIRLVEVDETALPRGDEQIAAYHFGPDPHGEIKYPSAIALVRPEDQERLWPPEGWGSWEGAEVIWRREQTQKV